MSKTMTRAEKKAEIARITAYLAARDAEDRAAGLITAIPLPAVVSLCVHGRPLGRGHECAGCREYARQYARRSNHVRAIEHATHTA